MEIIRAENVYTQAGVGAITRKVSAKALERISVLDFGAVGDGTTDDRAAIALATNYLISLGGGRLYFPGGKTYFTNSASALVSITDGNFITLEGDGLGSTILKQGGAGNVIELLGTSEIVGNRVLGMSLVGDNAAAKGIDTLRLKYGVIEDCNISGTLNHGIDFRGVENVRNTVSRCQFTSGVGALVSGRAINYRTGGDSMRIEDNYFNISASGVSTRTVTAASNVAAIQITTSAVHGLTTGRTVAIDGVVGNTAANGYWTVTVIDTTNFTIPVAGNGAYVSGGTVTFGAAGTWDTAIDARSGANLLLFGNTYDGCLFGVMTSTVTTAINERLDFSGVPIGFGFYPTASNRLTLLGVDYGLGLEKIIFNPNATVSDKYLTVIANNSANSGIVPGTFLASVITPAQITADQNDYLPNDATNAFFVGRYAYLWRVSADAAGRQITGMSDGVDGKMRALRNVGSFPIKIPYNAGSTAANRIYTCDTLDRWLRPGQTMTLVYEAAISRWFIIEQDFSQPRYDNMVTPAQITANQNNYAPTGCQGATMLRLSSDASRNITGIGYAAFTPSLGTGVNTYRLDIVNVGAQNIVFTNNDAASDADKQIVTGVGGNKTITPNQSVTMLYDATSTKWRIISNN